MFHRQFLALLSQFTKCQIMLPKFFLLMSYFTLLIQEKCCHCSAQMFLAEALFSGGANTSHFSSGPIPTRSQEMLILFGFGPRSKPSTTPVCCTIRREFSNINILICLRCTPPLASRMLPRLLMVCMHT